jgi:F0F1-type ATP synthase assembly protein I
VRKAIGPISLIINLGTLVVVATIVPLVVGIWLDNQLHTGPWITLIALILGILGATTGVYRAISDQYRKSG